MKKCCMNCAHSGAETMDDVACCNCCEDYEFFDPVDEEYAIDI